MQRQIAPSYALVYASIIPMIQRIGRYYGYAIGVHGSMATDLDLIAVAWVEDAKKPEVLIDAISEHFNLVFHPNRLETSPEVKPHGRLAWSLIWKDSEEIHGCGGVYLDISVIHPQYYGNSLDDGVVLG